MAGVPITVSLVGGEGLFRIFTYAKALEYTTCNTSMMLMLFTLVDVRIRKTFCDEQLN